MIVVLLKIKIFINNNTENIIGMVDFKYKSLFVAVGKQIKQK